MKSIFKNNSIFSRYHHNNNTPPNEKDDPSILAPLLLAPPPPPSPPPSSSSNANLILNLKMQCTSIISRIRNNTPPPPSPPVFLTPPPPSPPVFRRPSHHDDILKNLNKLPKPDFSTIESTLVSLLQNPACTHKILAAVLPFLHSLHERIQELAADVIHNLSLEASNATVLVGSEAVRGLWLVLTTGTPHARARAVEAIYNLVEVMGRESFHYRLYIGGGAVGIILPLLQQFLDRDCTPSERKKAMWLLYYQLSSCAQNVQVMAGIGAVEKLLEAVGDERSTASTRSYALVLIYCMMGSEMGRAAFFEVGGLGVLARRLRDGEKKVGMKCLVVMYRVCRESLKRFRAAAAADHAVVMGGVDRDLEEVLVEGVEEWEEAGKCLAREMVRVLRGEIRSGEEMLVATVTVQGIYDQGEEGGD